MAHVLNDRVKESSTTTGTGTITLAGATTGFDSFSAGIGTGNTTYYCITDGTSWEVGYGTVTVAGTNTLSRTGVYSSSNGDALVNFGAGTKSVFCTLPAAMAIFYDTSSNLSLGKNSSKTIGMYFPAASGISDYSAGGVGWKFARPADGLLAHAISTYDTAAGAKNNLLISSRSDLVFGAGATIGSEIEVGRFLGATGALSLPFGQITFPGTQNASAGANTLDDYEEGTWTPGITFGGAAVGVTYGGQVATYTKTGRGVSFTASMTLTSKGSSTGVVLFTGLPFTINASGNGACSIYGTALAAGVISLQSALGASATTIFPYNFATGSATQLANTDFANNSSIQLGGSFPV